MADPGESQASEVQANGGSVNLVELFQAGENGIERRRTENLFKQLDERQLTEDEQAIIQQRVELQRKMFQEYERREKQRKLREIQEVCPDLDEEAARRALEICNWREEEAAERLSSDPVFLKRVRAGGAMLEHAPAPHKPERHRSSGNRAPAVGPRPRLIDPSQVGAVFVGRFKSRLGPHQISAMGRQQPQQPPAQGAAGTAAPATKAGNGATARAQRGTASRTTRQPPHPSRADKAPGDAPPTGDDDTVAAGGAASVDGAAEHHGNGDGSGGDVEMADGAGGPAAAAGGEGGGEPGTEGAEEEASDAGGGEEEEDAYVDANSADLSDNELQYEDDVLPVMSPLGKRQRHAGGPDGQVDVAAAEGADVDMARAPGAAAAAVPGQSPMFRYRLVAETSTGNVHSVATEEWHGVLWRQQQHHHQQQQLDHHNPGQLRQQQHAQRQRSAGVCGEAAAAGVPAEGRVAAAVHNGAADDDEVSSPPVGQPQQLQPQRCQPPPPQAHQQPQQQQQQHPNLQQQHQHHQEQLHVQLHQDVPAATGAPQGAGEAVAAAAAAGAAAVAAARPRRAAAGLAGILRQVDRFASGPGRGSGGGRGRKGRSARGGHGADADDEDDEDSAAEETGDDDDGDSDFHVSPFGKGGAPAEEAMEAMSSEEEDLADCEEEEDSDAFVAPGSRKRRAGRAGAAAKRQQQPRRRGASGGSGGGAAAAAASGGPYATAAAVVAVVGTGEVAAAGAPATAAVAVAQQGAGPSGQPPPVAAAAAAGVDDSEATVTEDESPGGKSRKQPKGRAKGRGTSGGSGRGGKGGAAAGGGAISASGHTCRGRVKQKGVKRADLLAVGELVPRPGWYNAGYIFPAGFKAQTLFRSSVDLDSLTLHTCEILGETGQYWPSPTFVVTAADRPDEPLVAKSCTGCWTAVLRRINSEIEGRRAAGEDLPPPPKTAIAGPEYFGLNQPEICAAIEALDVDRACSTYWDGKMDREAARGGQPVTGRSGRGTSAGSGAGAAAGAAVAAAGGGGAAAASSRPQRPPRTSTGGGGGGRSRRGGGGRRGSGDDEPAPRAEGEEDPEETYAGNRWSAVTRAERYRKRCEEAGEDMATLMEASLRDNPLPGFLDPITLEPVVNPAISPYGHVMGLATWKAVLAEHGRCPFTKQPLKAEALTVLTKNNIERYRSRIIQQ